VSGPSKIWSSQWSVCSSGSGARVQQKTRIRPDRARKWRSPACTIPAAADGVASREVQAASSLREPVPLCRQWSLEAGVDYGILSLLPPEGAQCLLHKGTLRAFVGRTRPSSAASCSRVAAGGRGGGRAAAAIRRVSPTRVGGRVRRTGLALGRRGGPRGRGRRVAS